MNAVFADTFYWFALANRRDQWHSQVIAVRAQIGKRPMITTEEVLTEFLAAMSGDTFLRQAARSIIDGMIASPSVTILPQSHSSFMEGYTLYNSRPDKFYSLTDCISMNACRTLGITEILTNDRHFTQEGFIVLIPHP